MKDFIEAFNNWNEISFDRRADTDLYGGTSLDKVYVNVRSVFNYQGKRTYFIFGYEKYNIFFLDTDIESLKLGFRFQNTSTASAIYFNSSTGQSQVASLPHLDFNSEEFLTFFKEFLEDHNLPGSVVSDLRNFDLNNPVDFSSKATLDKKLRLYTGNEKYETMIFMNKDSKSRFMPADHEYDKWVSYVFRIPDYLGIKYQSLANHFTQYVHMNFELEDWVEENCAGRVFCFPEIDDPAMIFFEFQNDALLFKLAR